MNEISDDAAVKEALDATEAERRKGVFNDRMSLCRIYFYLSSGTDCFFFHFFVFLDQFTISHHITPRRAWR